MKKLLPGLMVCLMAAAAAQAAQDEWINRQEVNNPQVDARVIRNYGIINISPTGLPFTFDNNLEFYNDAGGILKISEPGITFDYHNSGVAFGKTNSIPMDLYFNEGTLTGGGSIRVNSREVIDSGVTISSGYGGIDIKGDSLDLWGASYQAMAGNSAYLDPDGHHTGAFSRPPSLYVYGWGHGVNDRVSGGPSKSIFAMAGGTSSQANLPIGGTGMVTTAVGQASNWWDDTNYKAYIRAGWYAIDDELGHLPFYQVVFVPNDTIAYEYEDPQDPTSPIIGCKSYNQFRVAFGGAPYDMPFQPYTPQDYDARAVIVYQYSYQAEDAQRGLSYPRYNQIIMEDLTGYFYTEMADNGYVQDHDAHGYIPDRFRVDCRNSVISYENFIYAPWRGMPTGQLALPPCYKVDPNTGLPVLNEKNERIPVWIQKDDDPSYTGPYLLRVAGSCFAGSFTEQDPDFKWIWKSDLGPRAYWHEGNGLVDVDYSVYSANVGADNAFNKKALTQQYGLPVQSLIDTSVAAGHVTIGGNSSVLDNMVIEAQESISLNITNLISADNIVLNANYISAFFSKVKEGMPEGTTLKLEEVVSPQMTRYMGDMAMYSGIYRVTFKFDKNNVYDREADRELFNGGGEVVPPDDGGEGDDGDEGGDGDEGNDTEETDVEMYFHVVYVNSSATHRTVYPNVDNFVVQTELPAEVNDTIALGEEFKFDTPALTLDGTMSFPKTVVDTNFVNMMNFTNLANLVLQGQIRNSGVFTNTYNESPSISFYLGQNRSPRLANLVNEGSFSFSEVNLDADYMAFINGGSAVAANSVTLTADKMLLNEAQLNGTVRTEVNTKELDIFASDVTGGDPNNQTSGTIILNIADRVYDGFNGVTNIIEGTPVVQNVPQNELVAMGAISIPNKPAAGDLMNTRISITNPRISRNTWSGDDRGDTLDGWTDNMALGALVLKGSISGNQALRYDFTSPVPNGAIYVRDLYLGVETSATEDLTLDYGKMLSFKNMKMYYVNCYQLELLPPPPGGSSTSTNAVWVLKDKFPGNNPNVVQTQHHPDWATPIDVLTTSTMAFSIRFASSVELSADDLDVTPLELRWVAFSGSTYKVEVADSLEGSWKTFYVTMPEESGEVIIPLDPDDSMKFFRLIRE